MAGRIMIERLNELSSQGVDFALETTLPAIGWCITFETGSRRVTRSIFIT